MVIPRRSGRRGRPPPDRAPAAGDGGAVEVGIVACDAEGELVLVNGAARRLLGAEVRRATGADGPLRRALRGERVDRTRVERTAGGPTVVEASAEAVVDTDGRVTGAVMVLSDVTARAEHARREFESAVADNLAEAVVVVRARDGGILYANATCERVFGHRAIELTGRHASFLSAGDEQTPGRRAHEIAAAVAAGQVWTGDVECRRKDGTRVWTSLRVSGLEHAVHGTVWICVHTEAAPRLAAEEAARAAETRFRAVFDNAPVPTLLIGRDFRVVDANPAAARLMGYATQDLDGRSLTDLTHPDDVAAGARLAARLFAGEVPEYRLEQRIVTRRGRSVRVAVTATAVSDGGRHAYAMATLERLSAPRAHAARWATATPS
jgi:sigma-54 dependent transcriptional regulator, acetoin dehydrogenase operon transcriptional activator AcoR